MQYNMNTHARFSIYSTQVSKHISRNQVDLTLYLQHVYIVAATICR